ncbi:MAG: hypothetical protein RBR59_00620 [Sulfurimonadaceae bacterium]|jgi:hypothetical protein|nr:hypothetical protein [Sulfurimonadaceae bacterium]
MQFLFLLVVPFLLHAEMILAVKDIELRTLVSQHEQEFTLRDGIWIVTWDKESTYIANEYFKNYGMRDDVSMIVDTSQVPSGIFKLFVKPNMKRYKHAILLSFDVMYNRTLPYKEGYLSVLTVQDKTLKEVVFVQTEAELEEFFK